MKSKCICAVGAILFAVISSNDAYAVDLSYKEIDSSSRMFLKSRK